MYRNMILLAGIQAYVAYVYLSSGWNGNQGNRGMLLLFSGALCCGVCAVVAHMHTACIETGCKPQRGLLWCVYNQWACAHTKCRMLLSSWAQAASSSVDREVWLDTACGTALYQRFWLLWSSGAQFQQHRVGSNCTHHSSDLLARGATSAVIQIIYTHCLTCLAGFLSTLCFYW